MLIVWMRLCKLATECIICCSRKICYRTTVDMCGTEYREYRLYLNKRNFQGLLRNCPNERQDLLAQGTEVVFQSPRFQCRKRNRRFYQYRNRELCLYNISVPNCVSGRVHIQQAESTPPELEERAENGKCLDYLQFYYGQGNSIKHTNPLCGVELRNQTNEDTIVLPATNFLMFILD